MTRAIWKNPFSRKHLFKGVYINKETKKQELIFIRSRECLILPSFVGSIFAIYDGKKFNRLHVIENMVGHRFGEFAATRKRVIHKKKTK